MFTSLQTQIISCKMESVGRHSVPRWVFFVRTSSTDYSCWYADSFASLPFHYTFPAQATLIRQGSQAYLRFKSAPKGSPIKVEYSPQLTDEYMQSYMGAGSHR